MDVFSDEQYDYWEKQFREELYPCSQQKEECEEESDVENSEAKSSSINESNYFNDSDDDYLEIATDSFQSNKQLDNHNKTTQNNFVPNDIKHSSQTEDRLFKTEMRKISSTDVPKIINSMPSISQSLSKIHIVETQIEAKIEASQTFAVKKLDFQPNNDPVSNDCIGVDHNGFNDLLTPEQEINISGDVFSQKDLLDDSRVSTQSKNGIIHWQSFQEDSEDEAELVVDGDENDYQVVSQWLTDTQLDYKIANNKAAQEVMKKRTLRSNRNPFLLEEAEEAFDDEECFLGDSESQDIMDESLAEFINNEDDVDTNVTEYHLKSYLTQSSNHEIPEIFKRKVAKSDMNILSDTDESDNNEENEYDPDDSFISESIIYADDSPEKVIQTQQMKLRSKRLIDKRKNHETPEKPRIKKRRRVIIESP